VLDFSRAAPETVGRALALPPYEAAQRVRRGGYQLYRVTEKGAGEEESERLRAAGVVVVTVPEAEVRTQPLLASGGAREGDALRLRAEGETLPVSPAEVLLVVWGPIVREYQALGQGKVIATARPAEGYRIHLHRRAAPRPLELDPANFEFGVPPVRGSSLLELKSWIEAVFADVPRDDGFRQEPPALSPAVPTGGAQAVERALHTASRARESPPILENLEQFRFYSAWRAAVERRR
jgi:hypothetical protein